MHADAVVVVRTILLSLARLGDCSDEPVVSRKHLRREPQHVGRDKDWWFYEENAGLVIVAPPFKMPDNVEVDGRFLSPRTRIVTIPWARVRRALARKDEP